MSLEYIFIQPRLPKASTTVSTVWVVTFLTSNLFVCLKYSNFSRENTDFMAHHFTTSLRDKLRGSIKRTNSQILVKTTWRRQNITLLMQRESSSVVQSSLATVDPTEFRTLSLQPDYLGTFFSFFSFFIVISALSGVALPALTSVGAVGPALTYRSWVVLSTAHWRNLANQTCKNKL